MGEPGMGAVCPGKQEVRSGEGAQQPGTLLHSQHCHLPLALHTDSSLWSQCSWDTGPFAKSNPNIDLVVVTP